MITKFNKEILNIWSKTHKFSYWDYDYFEFKSITELTLTKRYCKLKGIKFVIMFSETNLEFPLYCVRDKDGNVEIEPKYIYDQQWKFWFNCQG